MKINNTIKLAFKALTLKKLRTSLTILGISIGIAIVIAIMSAGEGLNAMVMEQVETFGPNTISIEVRVPNNKRSNNESAMNMAQGITITTLNERDQESISKHPNISASYGYLLSQEVLSYDGQIQKAMIAGEGYQMTEVEKFELALGRMFTAEEENSLSQVVVLGYNLKEKFFGDDDEVIGKIIKIKNKPFKVIGIAKERGGYSFMNMDEFVYMPVKTLQKKILGIDYYINIFARVIDQNLAEQTAKELEEIIRENHNITDPTKDDFAIMTISDAVEMITVILDGIILLLISLVSVSLLVGGVGIMNIMYVSVSERVFEIGLRKSLGARKKDILQQFLIESLLLTIAGSIVGIMLGLIFAYLIYLVAIKNGLTWVYIIPPQSILLAISFSAVIGLIFGLYPAKKASNFDPIVALRKE